MAKRLFFVMICLCSALESKALATNVKEAVKSALLTNPTISADEAEVRASQWEVDSARAGYFPSVGISGGVGGYENIRFREKNSSVSGPLSTTVTRFVTTPSVTVTQTIFDGLATPYAVEYAHKVVQGAQSVLGQTSEQIALDAITAYANLRAQERLLNLADYNIQKHTNLLEKVKKRVQGGISTIADVYQVESRLKDAIVIKDRFEGQREEALASFIDVVGFRPEALEHPHIPEDLLSTNVEKILTTVSQANPGILLANARLEIQKAAFDQTLPPFLPTLRVEAGTNGPNLNPFGTRGKVTTHRAQLVLDYNLYSGGKNTAQRNAARERVVEAKKRLDVARRNAAKQARSAWGTFISAHKQTKDAKKAVEVDEKLEHAYLLQFELVALPLLNLVDAYVSYFRAKADQINAEAEEDIRHATLLALMGMLKSTFLSDNECCEDKIE